MIVCNRNHVHTLDYMYCLVVSVLEYLRAGDGIFLGRANYS